MRNMANLYIFGVGGTGSRVLRSFAMLAASGVKIGDYDGIYPIIIDPDEQNGDKQRTITLLKKYMELKRFAGSSPDGHLFSPKIKNIKELLTNSDNTTDLRDFQFSTFYGAGSAFKQNIKYTNMDRGAQDLVKALFSDYHLDLDLELGFYGNPNIGVTVLNSFEDSSDFQLFARNFGTDDRIFIVGSIFGGTGASGFPLLVKTFRNPVHSAGAQALSNSKIGACVVMPYFNLSKDGNVSSNYFITKAKAALSYYEKNLDKVNDLYYIGDSSNFSQSYSEGGESQLNSAHLVELIAATSIFEFAVKDDVYLSSESFNEYYFNDANNKTEVDLYSLGKSTKASIASPLTKLFLMTSLHKQNYFEKNEVWFTDKLTDSFFSTGEGKKLQIILDLFVEWIIELGQNDRKFKPFDLQTDDFNSIIKGMPSTKRKLDKIINFFIDPFGPAKFHSVMNTHYKTTKADGLEYYLKLFDVASSEITKEFKLFR